MKIEVEFKNFILMPYSDEFNLLLKCFIENFGEQQIVFNIPNDRFLTD